MNTILKKTLKRKVNPMGYMLACLAVTLEFFLLHLWFAYTGQTESAIVAFYMTVWGAWVNIAGLVVILVCLLFTTFFCEEEWPASSTPLSE